MNKKILAAAAAGVLIAGTVFFFYSRQNSSNSRLKLSGTIEVTSVELSFKVPGKMQQRLVDEGETVKAGQVVARLEDTELKDERSARLAEQRAAQAGLADIRAGNRREEIAQGEAILARMRAEADKCAKDAVRMEALFRREVIPQKDLDTARAARDASAAAVREAKTACDC
jgi:HlyD family secretion protein